jgi:beta-1,4-mannosyl-glycoprotein beta-1,4-N-acetylglucosaminyltransferase
MLELRLELLYEHVDKFIISECDSTHSGIIKPFYFEMNKHRYAKFLDKIIYIKNYNSDKIDSFINIYSDRKFEIYNNIINNYNSIKNGPETDYGKPHWCRDFLHREYVSLGMDVCGDEDIIIFSDLDEFHSI